MRLELEILNIGDVQYADETSVRGGRLYMNRRELRELLQEDKRFRRVDVELAHPGEKCRIVRVADVIEPRAKTRNSGEDFPGVIGEQKTAGQGSTSVLRGGGVDLSDGSGADFHEAGSPNGEIIDMSGPAAELGIYGNTHNIILLPQPADGVHESDYKVALKIAGLKAAVYLARAGRGLKPDEVEVYDLPPFAGGAVAPGEMPRVAYIFQVLSLQYMAIPGDPVLYGSNIDGIVPTILHPNEVLDGAVTNPAHRHFGVQTYVIQNHPVIKELYRRHGKDLYFAGVILMIAHNNPAEFERAATIAANLSRWVLGADGVVLTKAAGGAPEVVMSRTALKCEELGVKTAMAIAHLPVAKEAGILYAGKELDAIVSLGSPMVMRLKLPAMERLVGMAVPGTQGIFVSEAYETSLRSITGSFNQLGISKLTTVRY